MPIERPDLITFSWSIKVVVNSWLLSVELEAFSRTLSIVEPELPECIQTGWRTRALYSTPLTIRGTVLGVLQFVNKDPEGSGRKIFSTEDGELVELFAAYIGLALHHAKLYDKIRKNQAKSNVSHLYLER